MNNMNQYIVVGAGFAGCVCARELAEAGKNILLLEKRHHTGGNAHDEEDDSGILVHRYGPHIFHTNSEKVFHWLSRFTQWRKYEHRVHAVLKGKSYPFPINRATLNQLYGLELNEAEAIEFLNSVREPRDPIRTSEDVVLNTVGRDLYEKFFLNYTRKQWGLDPSQLKAAVAARIPVRTNDDDRYFTDRFQAMPLDGYACMFDKILDHPLIQLKLNTDFLQLRAEYYSSGKPLPHIIYTGPVDAYFDYRFGRLPYRSLRFEHEHLPDIAQFQPVGTVNHPNENSFTRITEFKHLTGQDHPGTSIVREYPSAEGDPYYPIPSDKNERLFQQYQDLVDMEANTSFVGRLAQYRYYNMDQVVAAALTTVQGILRRHA